MVGMAMGNEYVIGFITAIIEAYAQLGQQYPMVSGFGDFEHRCHNIGCHREEANRFESEMLDCRRGDFPEQIGMLLSGNCFVVVHPKPMSGFAGYSQ